MLDHNQIIIRRAQADDDDAIQDFVNRTYGSSAQFKRSDRWKWQFLDNPSTSDAQRGASMWLAFSGETVVGQMGVQDCKIIVGEQRYNAGWIVDVMVDAERRGMGIGHSLHTAILAERPILMTLTMAQATRRIAQKAGAITLAPTKQWVRLHGLTPKTVSRFLSYKAQYGTSRKRAIRVFNNSKVGPWGAAVLTKAWTKIVSRKATQLDTYTVQEFEAFDTEISEFISKTQADLPAYVERSSTMQTWRYNVIPQIEYKKFIIRKDAEILGCLICRNPENTELPAGIVTDVIAHQNDAKAHDALLELAQTVLNGDCEFLEAAASTPQMSAALKRAGFIATRTMRPTIVCSDKDTRAVFETYLDGWHFTKADHDWDQIHPV